MIGEKYEEKLRAYRLCMVDAENTEQFICTEVDMIEVKARLADCPRYLIQFALTTQRRKGSARVKSAMHHRVRKYQLSTAITGHRADLNGTVDAFEVSWASDDGCAQLVRHHECVGCACW